MEVEFLKFETLNSANTWAKENVDSLFSHKLNVISAEEQTKGRGRFTRSWISPKGYNLYITFVFFQDTLLKDLHRVPQLLALSAVKVVRKLGIPLKIKWPNDLVLEKKKLGGILSEITQKEASFAYINGIGLNINMPEELLLSIDCPATSLSQYSQKNYDKEKILNELTEVFLDSLLVFFKEGFKSFQSSFVQSMMHEKGDRLILNDFVCEQKGIFQEINEEGALLFLTSQGVIKKCFSGEILYENLKIR